MADDNADDKGQPDQKPAPSGAPEASWIETLPEDLKGSKTLTKFKTVADVARGYVNLEKHQGGMVRIPGEGASPEEVRAYHAKLGVPDNPGGYTVKPALKEGQSWDGEAETSFRTVAHKAGMTPGQLKAVLDWYADYSDQAVQKMSGNNAQAIEKGMAELKSKWGASADRYLAGAQRVVRELGDPELVSYLEETGLGNHPGFVRFAAKIHELMAEDGIIKPSDIGVSPTDAKQKIAEVMGDPKSPYFDREHPDHKRLVAQVRDWHQIAWSAP